MTETRANSDELRHLAAQMRSTRSQLESAERSIGQLLSSIDRRGWASNSLDSQWRDAQQRVHGVLAYVGESPGRLERKAALIDDLNRRPWPGVFALATLTILGPAAPMLPGGRLQRPSVDATRWLASNRATALETASRALDVPIGFQQMDARDGKLNAIATLASRVAGKQLTPDQVAAFLRSSRLGQVAIGAAAVTHIVEGRDTYYADPDTDRGRALTGAVAKVAAKFGAGLVVGAGFTVFATSAPLWATIGVGGALILGPGLATWRGNQWWDPAGAFTEKVGQGWNLLAKGGYDALSSGGRKLANTLGLGENMARPAGATLGGSSRDLAGALLHSSASTLAPSHSSGVTDAATARQNIEDTASGRAAHRSSYGSAPGGTVHLAPSLLQGLRELGEGYSFTVSELAGGSHGPTSRHYAGVAADVTFVDGERVGPSNPRVPSFMQACRDLGATEVLGPGDPGHSDHVHCAWPRVP